jgi:hypothetical protein
MVVTCEWCTKTRVGAKPQPNPDPHPNYNTCKFKNKFHHIMVKYRCLALRLGSHCQDFAFGGGGLGFEPHSAPATSSSATSAYGPATSSPVRTIQLTKFLPIWKIKQNAISHSSDVYLTQFEVHWVRDDKTYALV